MPSGPLRGPHEEAEGLTLLKADTATGYWCVGYNPVPSKPYQARVRRGGKQVHLGSFATAEEAALCVARTPEGQAAAAEQAAAERVAPAPQPPASEDGQGTGRAMPPGALVKEEQVAPPMPPGAFFKEEGVMPPMPPDAIVKREHTVVVKEEDRSDGCAKRRRSK